MADLQTMGRSRFRHTIRHAGERAPAGLNPAQLGAWRRVAAARGVRAELEPLGADYLHGEAYFERMRRMNGQDR